MSGYIWYSAGSDVSGPKLAAALSFNHGKKTPNLAGLDVLVGWGCKPETRQTYDPAKIKSAVQAGSLRILNYPEEVTEARNKINTLVRLRGAGLAVPGLADTRYYSTDNVFSTLEVAVDKGTLQLPCVGFNEFHKGRPVFCWTKEDLKQAVENHKSTTAEHQIHYFRSLFHGTEYRVHVFRDEALCAEVKVLAKDPIGATTKSIFERLKRRGPKEVKTTEGELRSIVEELATDLLRGPSHLQRSVQHGWEMTDIPLEQVPAAVISSAITALDVVGLDMGAVSVILEGDQGIVTNVTTSPALDDAKLTLYAEAVKEFVGNKNKAEKKEDSPKKVKKEGHASQEILARITQKLRTVEISQTKAEELLAALE